MAIIVKAEITITKGFNTWKSMVKKNQDRMEEMAWSCCLLESRKMNQLNFMPL